MAGFGSSDHLLALRHTASRTLDRTRVSSKFTKSMCARPDQRTERRAQARFSDGGRLDECQLTRFTGGCSQAG